MRYYDATSSKVRDTMNDEFIHPYYNQKAAKVCNIFAAIAIILMVITVILQIFWFNIVLHTVLCSVILTLIIGCLVCNIIQKDKKNTFIYSSWLFLWTANVILNLTKYFSL